MLGHSHSSIYIDVNTPLIRCVVCSYWRYTDDRRNNTQNRRNNILINIAFQCTGTPHHSTRQTIDYYSIIPSAMIVLLCRWIRFSFCVSVEFETRCLVCVSKDFQRREVLVPELVWLDLKFVVPRCRWYASVCEYPVTYVIKLRNVWTIRN